MKSPLVRLACLLLAAGPALAAPPFLGPIPVQFVEAGGTVSLDLHRFYQAGDDSRVEIPIDDAVQTGFDRKSLRLQITVGENARGLINFPLRVTTGTATKTANITLAIRGRSEQEFAFQAPATVKTVTVAGSFNGWNKESHALTRGRDGIFRLRMPLDGGTQRYKFVVDGEWQIDPANPVKEADGFGGMNSVVQAKAAAGSSSIFAEELSGEQLRVRRASAAPLSAAIVLAELPDQSQRLLEIRLTSGEFIVPTRGLPPGTWLRVIAADETGACSNVLRLPLGPADFRWQDAVLYYALTDRFLDGDKANNHPVQDARVLPPANFHGGDWRGIEQKIRDGYFQNLGVNTLWIAPLNENPAGAYQESPEPHRWYTGYHGYWPVSPTKVDSHFGDAAALHSLVRTAHEAGMKVIADLVLHHVHTEHPWWKAHREWFGQLELPDGTLNLRKWDDRQFTTWFEPYLPTFDFSRDAAVQALIENAVWWAKEYELDGFRLDAVKHIPHEFWWRFRSALREQLAARPNFYLVGETFQDRAGIAGFVGPNMLDGQFDFPLYDSIKETLAEEKAGLDQLEAALTSSEQVYGREALMSPLVGNHDKGRFMAYADGDLPAGKMKEEEVGWKNPPQVDRPESFARLELAQAFLLSIDGVPMIYYGDEIGMTGAGDPDNRRDMRFGDAVQKEESKVLANFRKLNAIRRAHPALRYGSRRTLVAEKEYLAYLRAHLDDRVLCLFNRSQSAVKRELAVAPEFAPGKYRDQLNGARAEVRDGRITVELPARTAAFFVRE